MKKKPTVGSFFSGCFLLTASLRRQRMSKCISLFTVLPSWMNSMIPANSGNFLKLLRYINYEENVLYYILITVYKSGFSEKVA